MKKLVIVIIIGANDALMHLPASLCIGQKAYDEYLFAMTKDQCTYIEGRTPLPLEKVIILSNDDQKVVVFPGPELYQALIQEPQDSIDSLHVIKLLEDGQGDQFETPSMLYWRPIVKESPPGITFTRYSHSPLEL